MAQARHRTEGWRTPRSLLALVCVTSLLSVAATTCWTWRGVETRLLDLDTAVEMLHDHEPDEMAAGMTRLVALCEATARQLRTLGERDDLLGARARVWLVRLQESCR